MKVWLLPIEPFEERYTGQWYRWWPAELRAAGLEVEVLNGEQVGKRDGGEFLGPIQTWLWKGAQITELARAWRRIKPGDVILTLDAWGSASTAACYMRDTTGLDVKVVGYWHAGSYDPHDFLARCGMRRYAMDIEEAWMRGLDLNLVATKFHRGLMLERALYPGLPRIEVVGQTIHQAELAQHRTPWEDRGHLVVFPHRLAPEKDPEAFERIRLAYESAHPRMAKRVQWVRSRDVYTDKASYHQLLGRARCVVSTAKQETFGIAMQEGVALGAWAICPKRLSYPELFPDDGSGGGACYYDDADAVKLIHLALTAPAPAPWTGKHEDCVATVAARLRTLWPGRSS